MGFILDLWLRFNQNRHVRKVTGSKVTACMYPLRSDRLSLPPIATLTLQSTPLSLLLTAPSK